jgi:HPr kinase/phosphorylase
MSEANIHASCVAIGANGVLLVGGSGAGKSDLALRLIDQGAGLVADDRTILYVAKGLLYARAPATIKGLLEIRGLGIIDLPTRQRVKIALVVKLGRQNQRLPSPCLYRPPPPLLAAPCPPEITLDARLASTPAKIRAAVVAFSQGLFRDTFTSK